METRITRIGDYTFVTNPRDVYIGKSLEVYGEYSYGEIALIKQILKPNANVVEVGANIGSHTVFLAREVCPQGQVYAFEPRRLTFQLLCANVAVNALANVHTYREGLGHEPGTFTEGPLPIEQAQANFGGLSLGALPGTGESFEIKRLDDYLDFFAPVNLIKADVEGWERDVLLGGTALIERDRPLLYLENHYEASSADLIRTVMDMDYRLWWHVPRMFRPDNRAGTPFNLFGRIKSNNMLCVPSERKYTIQSLEPIESVEDRPGSRASQAPQ